MTHNKGLVSARLKYALYNIPKARAKVRHLSLPVIKKIEASCGDVSDNLKGQGKKIIIPSSIIDNYTSLEVVFDVIYLDILIL